MAGVFPVPLGATTAVQKIDGSHHPRFVLILRLVPIVAPSADMTGSAINDGSQPIALDSWPTKVLTGSGNTLVGNGRDSRMFVEIAVIAHHLYPALFACRHKCLGGQPASAHCSSSRLHQRTLLPSFTGSGPMRPSRTSLRKWGTDIDNSAAAPSASTSMGVSVIVGASLATRRPLPSVLLW